MKGVRGFTLIELLTVVAIGLMLVSIVFNVYLNNRGATEDRAFSGANSFVEENGIQPIRISCAGDSDNDGYGTCTVVTAEKEKILLKCPTDYVDVSWFGASGCKEVFQNINFTH